MIPLSKQTVLTSLQESKWFGLTPNEWLPRIIAIHFDPDHGSPYWLDKEKELKIKTLDEIKTLDDLQAFGPMCEDDLRKYPIEHFIPQAFLHQKRDFILGETAGTTGKPKMTAYREHEFYTTFVDWFGYIAQRRGFPTGGNWLWIGPSGPHIIGKAARPVARRMGGMDPFSIDFDPRWAKKLMPGTIGSKRYLEHILEQSLDIIETQKVDVLYTTPVVLKALSVRMREEQRLSIKGVHYGGVSIEKDIFKKFKEEYFPNSVHISGYGNTLFGLCLEIEESPLYDLDYYPPGPRMVVQVVSTEEGTAPSYSRLGKTVDYGESGQVVFHRFDESFFIPNMFERDKAVRIAPTPAVREYGVMQDGVKNPTPLEGNDGVIKTGLY